MMLRRCAPLVVFLACAGEPTSDGQPSGPCGAIVPGQRVTVEGVVEKGPFTAGAEVSITALDADGAPTDQVFTTVTRDGLGTYSVPGVPAGPVVVSARGDFYDELDDTSAGPPVTLRAFARVGADSPRINVNVVTHILAERAQAEFAAGVCVREANGAALDALGRFGLPVRLSRAPHTLSVVGPDDDDNALVLAYSAVVLQASRTRPGLQQLLDALADDLVADTASAATIDLGAAVSQVPIARVEQRLGDYLAAQGRPAAVPDMHRIFDPDHDEVDIGEDNCPFVKNHQQLDADHDGIGDICDCGDLPCECGPDAPDGDADGYPDACDNCPQVANPTPAQEWDGSLVSDIDSDGLGNACDACPHSPQTGSVPGESCCDPRGSTCTRAWPGSILWWRCEQNDERFDCIPEHDCVYNAGYGRATCQFSPNAPAGALAPVCDGDAACACDSVACGSKWCTVPDDTCEGDLNVCLRWYPPGAAPKGLEDLGACARVDQGPCVDKFGVECMPD